MDGCSGARALIEIKKKTICLSQSIYKVVIFLTTQIMFTFKFGNIHITPNPPTICNISAFGLVKTSHPCDD